jgi:hypothetical protein
MMHSRHFKLLGFFAMGTFSLWSMGLYLYSIFHYHHVWSILVIGMLQFFAFITPAVCFGYNLEDPQFFLTEGGMSEQCFLNWRDGGYMVAFLLYWLTFIMPLVPWYSSDGTSLSCGGVMTIHWANAFLGLAYVGFLRLVILDYYYKKQHI